MGPLCQTVGGPERRRQSICLASLPAGPERFHLSVMKLDLVHFLFVYHAALNFLSMHKHEETVRKTKALSGGREGKTWFYFMSHIKSKIPKRSLMLEKHHLHKRLKNSQATLNERNDEQYIGKTVPKWLHSKNTVKGLRRLLTVLRDKSGHGNTTAWLFQKMLWSWRLKSVHLHVP